MCQEFKSLRWQPRVVSSETTFFYLRIYSTDGISSVLSKGQISVLSS